mgnify:CR=1 FL=1
MHLDGYVALAGLIVGMAVGLTGMGGGALMTPVLVLVFGVQPLAAVSSDLVASLVMKPVGAAVHAARGTVQWPLVACIAVASVPSAFAGVLLLRTVHDAATVQQLVQAALGAVLLLCVGALITRGLIRRPTQPQNAPRHVTVELRPVPTLAVGLVVGFIVGITSTGSGTLVIVMLLVLYPQLSTRGLVGTDLVQAIPMVGAAAVAHLLFGDFRLGLTLSIVVGSVPGVLLGSLISSRAMSARATQGVRLALIAVLLLSGLRLLGANAVMLGAAAAVALVAMLVTLLLRRPNEASAAT